MKQSIKRNKWEAQFPLWITGFAILLLTVISACSENGTAPVDENEMTFEEIIASGGTFEPRPESRTVDTLSTGEPVTEDREFSEGGSPKQSDGSAQQEH